MSGQSPCQRPKAASRVIRPTEMAEMLECGISALWHRASCGVIPPPSRAPGRKPFWNRRDIEAWFEAGCPTAERWTELKGKFPRGSVVAGYIDRMEEDRIKAETKQRLRVQIA